MTDNCLFSNLISNSRYLIRFNGIDFLTEHYEAEHLLSLDDAIQDLTQVCLNNGGGIQ